MVPIVLRIVMVGVVVWGLWRIYTTLYPARRPQTGTQDEWQDVLEAIEELPEATESHLDAQNHSQPLPIQSAPYDRTESKDTIESVIVDEAEVALSLVREGDEDERLAAYYEIATYEKLCTIADDHISEAARIKIGDIYQRALEMICPPDDD